MISFLRRLFGKRDVHPLLVEADRSQLADFVYVKIPESLMPLDRGDKYDDPLLTILESKGVGEVTGGGSSLGDEQPDGKRLIEFIGLDVDLNDLDTGLPIVREALVQLGAPSGTEIHYTRGAEKLQDIFNNGEWQLGLERTFLHPGFGI